MTPEERVTIEWFGDEDRWHVELRDINGKVWDVFYAFDMEYEALAAAEAIRAALQADIDEAVGAERDSARQILQEHAAAAHGLGCFREEDHTLSILGILERVVADD